MNKKKVLFTCVHNAARSQMAEAFLKQIAGDKFEVESAGLKPSTLNPIVVEVMKEIGIDISANKPQSIQCLLDKGKTFDYIFTLCNEAQAERCPIFPGGYKRIHMGFADPSCFRGSCEEKLEQTRKVRNKIKKTLEEWVSSVL